jgi:hypothetical protein
MKQLFLLVFVASIIIALTTGCDKKRNGGGDDDNPAKKMIPSEILCSNYDFMYKFSYDNKNYIVEVKEFYGDQLHCTQDYVYNEDGRLDKITHRYQVDYEYVTHFSYLENFVVFFNTEDRIYTKFELQNDRLINAYVVSFERDELLATYSYDSKDNAIKVLSKGGGEVLISYANRKGVYSEVNMPDWFLLLDFATDQAPFHTVNNPSQLSDSRYYSTFPISYSYEAYNNDYPVKMTVTYKNYPFKKSKILPNFNRKKKHTKSISGDENDYYFEIKYIEAK